MRLVFHGGAREVGRSCVEVVANNNRLLLDCGLKLTTKDTEYPIGIEDPAGINAVFISHAHLDHTGALPLLDHQGMGCPVFATSTTRKLTRLLLKDAFKIGRITHQHLGYEELDIKKVLNCMRLVKVDIKGQFDSIAYEFFDAGHIPGAASVFLNIGGTTLLYTGDINTSETRLHNPAETGFPEVDIMICESTYGDREHPSRSKTDEEFITSINKALARGGSVIIPVFALGRSQEILLLLSGSRFKVPIFFDGMGVEVTDITLEEPDTIKDAKALKAAFKKVKIVRKGKDRMAAMNQQSIIVTTSGMLTGGPVMDYLKYLGHDEKNAVFLTGYQGEGTNGRLILEKRQAFIDGSIKDITAEVRQFDFSAHSGEKELKALVRDVKPKKVFFMHGEEHSALNLVEWAHALGMEAYAPKIGESFDV